MRFGKRLAEVTRGRGAHEPYVSYKELKHTVSKVANLIGSARGHSPEDDDDDAGSSLDEGPCPAWAAGAAEGAAPASAAAGCATPGPAVGSTGPTGAPPARVSRMEAHQREFFRRIDTDVAQAKAYVQGAVSALEAQVGDWQAAAVVAGILFTPDQLEEISAQLPFQVDDQQALVEWLIGLQPAEKRQAARGGLLEKYSAFAGSLNVLLQYIEVNLTAVRKIFKKFEKKVPVEMRIQNVREYKAHHDLYMPAMQHLLVTAVQIQRLVLGLAASPGGGPPGQEVTAVAISQIGSESLALLSWLHGPAALEDVLGGGAAAPIDVYAKPAADLGGRAAAPSAAPMHGPGGYPPADAAPQRAAAAGAPETAPGVQAMPQAPVPVMASGPEALAAAMAGMAGRMRSAPAMPPYSGPAASGDARQEAAQEQAAHEQEAFRSGRRRGGRGSRGGGRGRRGPGTQQPGQGAAPTAGRGAHQQAPGEGGVAERGRGPGAWPAGAVPQYAFAALPMQAGKAGAQGIMAGRGGGGCGRGGPGGKGAMPAAYHAYAHASGGHQGAIPTLDPHWVAAMMPMFWPAPAGVLQMEGLSQQGPGA